MRRFRTPVGEIDIIARRFNTIAFVEVKARATLDSVAQGRAALLEFTHYDRGDGLPSDAFRRGLSPTAALAPLARALTLGTDR